MKFPAPRFLASVPGMKETDPVMIRSPRTSRTAFALLATVGAFALSGCTEDSYPQDVTDPAGPYARKLHLLARWPFLIAIVLGIFVYALVLFASWRYRRRDEDDVPVQVHGNTAMEIGWTAAPAILLAVIGVFSVSTIFDVAREPKDALHIEVIGHQWWWEYRYPTAGKSDFDSYLTEARTTIDAEGKVVVAKLKDEADGEKIVSAGELHIPAGRPVRLSLMSRDVMHNWWVPRLAGKLYAIPGHVNHLNIEADPFTASDPDTKTLYGQCAEFCGTSHAYMRFKVVVHRDMASFEAWRAATAAPAAEPVSPEAVAGKALFAANCSQCHWLEPNRATYDVVDAETGEVSINLTNKASKIGPNLTHIASRGYIAGATATNDERNLRAWLRNPQAFKPGARMVLARPLTEQEVTDLVAYLRELK